jgi:hypothetical protein
MISERKFAHTYTAFWNNLTPLSNYCVHTLNENAKTFAKTITTNSAPYKRALIAEIGFELFVYSLQFGKVKNIKELGININDVVLHSKHRLVKELNEYRVNQTLDSVDLIEINGIAQNLLTYFNKTDISLLKVRPSFQGCGVINKCEGDFVYGDDLIEIKSVNRTLRVIDVRQILVYLALDFIERRKVFKNIIFINPRLGTFIKLTTANLAVEISGMELFDLLNQIVLSISDLSSIFVEEPLMDRTDWI